MHTFSGILNLSPGYLSNLDGTELGYAIWLHAPFSKPAYLPVNTP